MEKIKKTKATYKLTAFAWRMGAKKHRAPYKFISFALALALCGGFFRESTVFAQEHPLQEEQLRVQIWAELDAFPGRFDDWSDEEASESPKQDAVAASANPNLGDYERERLEIYSFAINRAKEIAPFFLSGMISGWTFDYVPYDRTRQVAEVFDYDEIRPLDRKANPIIYKNPIPQENRLLCWVYCDRTETQQLSFRRWSSINLPKVRGTGRASVEKGFDGIKEAAANAIKDAVRTHWRIYEKNKPKEIEGKVLLIGTPRVYISRGQYVADLEFFLETDRIVKYAVY